MRTSIEKEASKALGAVLAGYVRENGQVEVDRFFATFTRHHSPFINNARCKDCLDYPKMLTERGVVVGSGKEWVYADIDFESLTALVKYSIEF